MNLFAGQQQRHRYSDRLEDTVWEGEGGRIESSIETYTVPYVEPDRQWKFCCMMQGAQIQCL